MVKRQKMDNSRQPAAPAAPKLPPGVKLLRTLAGHDGPVWSVAFAADGRTLASGSDDGTVKLWEPATGRALRTLTGHQGPIWSVAFAPDGRTLASAGHDRTVKLWEPATGRGLFTFRGHTHPVRSVCFTPKGRTLVSASDDRTIKLWDLSTGYEQCTLLNHEGDVNSVAFASDDRTLISGSSDSMVKLWDPPTGRELRTLAGHDGPVYSVTSALHARKLASSSYDRTVRLWDLSSGGLLRVLEGHVAQVVSVLFSPDGRLLASTGTDGTVCLWSCGTWDLVNVVPARVEGSLRMIAVAFHPCSSLLARSGPWDNMPTVTTTETLAAMREFVARLKGERKPPVKDAGTRGKVPPMLTIARLYRLFESDTGKQIPLEEFIAHVERLEATDAVDLLLFHTTGQEPQPEDRVLLDPTRVDAYASALLVTAKDEPDGPGHLLESRVREGRFKLPEGERLGDPECEKHLLWYVMESLFARDLALRERIKGQDYVVFPSQCTAEMKFPGAGTFGVAFGMAGPVRSIYATLIAQLAHYEGFKKRAFFLDAAAYRAEAGGRCLLRLRDHADGTAELHVSFDDETQARVRQGFLEFVGRHLEAKCVPGSVTRRHAYHCRTCKNAFEDRIVKARLEDRKRSLLCPLCEKRTPLVNLLAPPTKAGASVAQRMDVNARVGRKRITAAWVIKGKEAQGKYDVFLSHNSKDKAAVEKIAKKLKSVGIRPWLDKWDLVPGDRITKALERAIESIPCGVLFFGPADVGNWHIMEIDAYLEEWAARKGRFVPVILPGVEGKPELPMFVRQALWVDMRDWEKQKSDAFYRLVCGILGRRPGEAPMGGFSARHVFEWQDVCL